MKCGDATVYRVPLARWSDTGYPLTSFRRAEVTLFVCGDCGYTETWTDEASLARVREHGRLVAPRPGPGDPDPLVIRVDEP